MKLVRENRRKDFKTLQLNHVSENYVQAGGGLELHSQVSQLDGLTSVLIVWLECEV